MATKLTNTQKATIQEELSQGKGISDIAKDLSVPLSVVKDYLVKMFESMAKVKELNKTDAKKNAPKTIKDLMVTKTRDQQRSGVAAMTQAASERSDDFKKQLAEGGKQFISKYSDCLHTIDPNKKS